MKHKLPVYTLALLLALGVSCTTSTREENNNAHENQPTMSIQDKLNEYAEFTLTTDVSKLSDNQKKMIPLLIDAAKIMDDLFWKEAYGSKAELMQEIPDEATRKFAEINYGPWDRLRND